ncbi:MAG: class I SAM-dependent methyltransferase [Gemmataceae bacterium]
MADYLRFHGPRFEYLLRVLDDYVQPQSRVLDIGMSRLTEMIHERFGCAVDAMGFGDDRTIDSGDYYRFDLNDCQFADRCRDDLPAYDTIVFAEVLEHLHTSPRLVLEYLAGLLAPTGVLIVQTPNAVALPRRLAMMLGRNPYELIREDWTNPGHFREYTARELCDYAAAAELSVERVEYRSYFDYRFCHHGETRSRRQEMMGSIKNAVYPWLPKSLRPGLTVVLRKQPLTGPGYYTSTT